MIVTLNQIDEKTIWISSDEDPLGKEVVFEDIEDAESQMMIALADYLDLDLTYEEIDDKEFDDTVNYEDDI